MSSVATAQVGSRALPSLFETPRLVQPEQTTFALAGSAGYGLREPLGDSAHKQQLIMGALGAGLQTRSGFAAELRVDGRLEKHATGGSRSDDGTGLVGSPRAYLRYARALRAGLSMGAELGVWLPGGKAPSLRVKATTLDALLGVDARVSGPWSVVAAAGFRFDQSARAFAHPERLSPGDFTALGLSDSHAVLARLGSELALPRSLLFVEWTWDLLIGQQAPALFDSPMHVALGARTALDKSGALRLLSAARVLASQRPQVDQQGPLVPFPARAELWLGLSYGLGKQPAREPVSVAPIAALPTPAREEPAATPLAPEPITQQPAAAPPVVAVAEAPVVEPPSGQVRLLVRDNRTGEALLATVLVRPADQAEATTDEHKIGADGRLELTLAPGRYEVEIKLYGWRKQKKTIAVEDDSVTLLDVGLHARSKTRERE